MKNSYYSSVIQQFNYYKSLGDRTFEQLSDDEIQWKQNKYSNSISIIVKHIVGNMLSRWTNFLTEDGEKKWRQRDTEFENPSNSKESLISIWERGWKCLFDALDSIDENDLERIIYIRNQGHTVTEAINRQLCHYSYHVGQIVFLAKMIKGDNWRNLSVAKNKSATYNLDKFSKEKGRRHFTEDL
jgi:hypothetical protein